MNQTVGDFLGNLEKIRTYTERALEHGADLVIFPELSICGYWPADLLEKDSFLRRAEECLQQIAEWTRGARQPAILCGLPVHANPAGQEREGKRVCNVAVLLQDGEVKLRQGKMLLPFYDVFDEQRYFEPAAQQRLTVVKGRAAAVTVCEDAWNDKMFWPRRNYPVDPIEELMKQWGALPQPLGGPRLILNISASPYWHGKPETRRRMIGALAKRHRATVVMVNLVGANDSLIFDGDSFAMNERGEVVAQCRSFAEDLQVFDSEQPEPVTRTHVGEDRTAPAVEAMSLAECERTWNALVLGTRDYLRKCGFRKALVGLSGGIDSALVAAIAVEALGAENVHGIGMPSEFSSTGSVSDAETLAKNLGMEFSIVPVKAMYAAAEAALQPVFARAAGGAAFGLAEENLQPRLRANILMALSNKTGALVLTTGNKSEMACGYCTLYGDMAGALAVIADLYKTEVYALSRYANRVREVIPLDTLTKPPSAELRPGQKDTDSLPPYEVLDPILRAYIEDYAAAEEIVRDQKVDLTLVKQVLRLVEIAEYKRQQAAPVLKVSKKAFGMGRRFPIAAKREV